MRAVEVGQSPHGGAEDRGRVDGVGGLLVHHVDLVFFGLLLG